MNIGQVTQKGLAPIIILIFIFVTFLVGGYYFLFKKPSCTYGISYDRNTFSCFVNQTICKGISCTKPGGTLRCGQAMNMCGQNITCDCRANLLMQPLTPSPTVSKPDETANWKTYRNAKLGFSLQYPEEWHEPKETILSTKTMIEFDGIEISVGVSYDQNLQRELTYKEVIKQYSNGKKDPALITINGQSAAYLKMRDEDLIPPKPNPFNLVSLQKGSTVYTIFQPLSMTLKEQNNEQRIFNQILSTFRFLNMP